MAKENKQTEHNALYRMLGNVSIAKFMGLQPIKAFNENTGKEYYYYNDSELQDFDALPSYDYDWNYLMAVVEKINKRDWVRIYSDECRIHSLNVGEFEEIKVVKEGEPLINVVYEAVLKYVELGLSNVA